MKTWPKNTNAGSLSVNDEMSQVADIFGSFDGCIIERPMTRPVTACRDLCETAEIV